VPTTEPARSPFRCGCSKRLLATTQLHPRTFGEVDPDFAYDELPLALAVALRLHAAGASKDLIATALAIEPEGVSAFLAVAEAKLRHAAGPSIDLPLTRGPEPSRPEMQEPRDV